MLPDVIGRYQDLLDEQLAADSHARLVELQRRQGLTFGGQPLCSVLRPRFLTLDQYRFVQRRVELLLRAFRKAHEAALADPFFRRQFRLSDMEEALLAWDPRFDCPMPTGRLDAFLPGEGSLRVTELNAETPAGQAYTDVLATALLALPVMEVFQRHYHVLPIPARQSVLHALLRTYHQWSGRRDLPRVAIVDWKEVPTRQEHVLFQDYLGQMGLECFLADPREVEYREADRSLWAGGRRIDLIYKRVLIGELLQRGGLTHPIVRAVRDGAVCMVNPFRCKVLYKKASLAVLSDERNVRLFSQEELQAIREHVPWTRVVEERKTTCGAHTVDLVAFMRQHRQNLVLKPNDDYGGKGIVLGWLADEGRWDEAIRVALAEPHVVQERIVLPEESFPSMVEGRLEWQARHVDTAPFVHMGSQVQGCLTRIAADPLLNVSAGTGSTVPTFLVAPR